jgi:hypothetical protein
LRELKTTFLPIRIKNGISHRIEKQTQNVDILELLLWVQWISRIKTNYDALVIVPLFLVLFVVIVIACWLDDVLVTVLLFFAVVVEDDVERPNYDAIVIVPLFLVVVDGHVLQHILAAILLWLLDFALRENVAASHWPISVALYFDFLKTLT